VGAGVGLLVGAWIAAQSNGEVCLVGRTGRVSPPDTNSFLPLIGLADMACLTLTRADISSSEETAGCVNGDRRMPNRAVIHAGKLVIL